MAPYPQQPHYSGARPARTPWIAIAVTAGIVVLAGISGFVATLSAPAAVNGGVVHTPVAPTLPTPPSPKPGVAWKRIEAVDIRASVEQAKATLPKLFPEAEIEQDKTYSLDLDHPILTSVRFSWSWGCSCLEDAVFYFKDYATRMRTLSTFQPCLERGLGPVAKSAPPFDYDWPEKAGVPRVHFGPQTVLLFIEPSTTEDGYRRAIRVIDGCRN